MMTDFPSALPVLGREHRHDHQRVEPRIAPQALPQAAFFDEPLGGVQVPRPRVELLDVEPQPVGLVLLEGETLDGAHRRAADTPALRRHDDAAELEAAVRAQKPQEQHEAGPVAWAPELDDAVSDVRVAKRPGVLLSRPGQDEPGGLGVPFRLEDEVEVLRRGRAEMYGRHRFLAGNLTRGPDRRAE